MIIWQKEEVEEGLLISWWTGNREEGTGDREILQNTSPVTYFF
jgi:hypothetical protein